MNNVKQYWHFIAFAVIGVTTYFAFTPLFSIVPDGFQSAFVSAAFSSSFIVVLTMFLLKTQTQLEQDNKIALAIYESKLKLYQDVLNELKEIFSNDKLKYMDVQNIEFNSIRIGQLTQGSVYKIHEDFANEVAKIWDEGKSDPSYEKEDEDTLILKGIHIKKLKYLITQFSLESKRDLESNASSTNSPNSKTDAQAGKKNSNTSSGIETPKGEPSSGQEQKIGRDYTKYKIAGSGSFGKSALVYEFVKLYVEIKKTEGTEITFDDLEKAFPQKWQREGKDSKNENACVVKKFADIEDDEKAQKRFRCKVHEQIPIKDKEMVVVSNQWGKGNINYFIKEANKKHIKYKKELEIEEY